MSDKTPIPKTEQSTTIEEWKRKLERVECPPREFMLTVWQLGRFLGKEQEHSDRPI